MSIGGTPGLGTLLVQRLDAVLGTTLSQQANLATGARPDAVSQPANAERNEAAQNRSRNEPREGADKALAQAERQAGQRVARRPADLALAALVARDALRSDATRSAPTTLGRAAQAILALLEAHPGTPGPVQARRPLLSGALAMALASGSTAPAAEEGNEPAPNAGRQNGAPPSHQSGSPSAPTSGDAAAKSSAAGARGTLPAPASAMADGPAASSAQQSGPLAFSTASTALSAALAQALSRSVQESGLFYESHLSELAFGRRSIESVRAEPQAQAAQPSPGQSTSGQGAAASPTSGGQPALPPSAATPHAPGTPAAGALAAMDPNTHVLVRQQLEVLAHQHIAWQGEAWPGTTMDCRISRRQESTQDGKDDSAPAQWATRLRLSLPELGEVEAEISLVGTQLALHVDAPQSWELLREHAETLRDRLGGQGLDLGRFSVSAAALPEAPLAGVPEASP